MTYARYWVCTDLETTGLDPVRYEIIQIARVVVDCVEQRVVPGLKMSCYVRPSRWETHTPRALEVNRLNKGLLDERGRTMYDALGAWARDINWEESVVAAWPNTFEGPFLTNAFKEAGRVVPFNHRVMDVRTAFTLPMLALACGTEETAVPSLEEAFEVARGYKPDPKKTHDALYDAEMTAEVLLYLLRSETWTRT